MSHSNLNISCLVIFVLAATVALAQDFSADVVSNKQTGDALSKVYSTKDKARFEFRQENDRMAASAMIIDEAQGKSFILIEQRHMYMEPQFSSRTPAIVQFWHVDDVNDACPQWKKAAERWKTQENWGSCSKVGNDTVNGRSAVKYEGVDKKGDKGYYWVDTKLKHVVKAENGRSTFELQNIQEGSQPARLFEIPAGYTKFDMGAMMRQRQ